MWPSLQWHLWWWKRYINISELIKAQVFLTSSKTYFITKLLATSSVYTSFVKLFFSFIWIPWMDKLNQPYINHIFRSEFQFWLAVDKNSNNFLSWWTRELCYDGMYCASHPVMLTSALVGGFHPQFYVMCFCCDVKHFGCGATR